MHHDTWEEHERLVSSAARHTIFTVMLEDEPNDLRHDLERETGEAEDRWLRRRGYVDEMGV